MATERLKPVKVRSVKIETQNGETLKVPLDTLRVSLILGGTVTGLGRPLEANAYIHNGWE